MKLLSILSILLLLAGCSTTIQKDGYTPSAPKQTKSVKIQTAQEALDAVLRHTAASGDLVSFPKTPGIRDGVVVRGRAPYAKDVIGTFETIVTSEADGTYQVTFTRRWEWDLQPFSTTWRFRVESDATITDLGKAGYELPEF